MKKLGLLKNILLVLLVIAVVYFVVNYAGYAKSYDVQGASTQKAAEITENMRSDVGSSIDSVKEQALQVSLGDAISGLSRLQKIPQDFHLLQEYVKEQIINVLESRK